MKKIVVISFFIFCLNNKASEHFEHEKDSLVSLTSTEQEEAAGLELNPVNYKLLKLLTTEKKSAQQVQELIAQGADLNANFGNGDNALMVALNNPANSKDIIFVLLQHGANPKAVGSQDSSVLMVALENLLDTSIVELLISNIQPSANELNSTLEFAVQVLNQSIEDQENSQDIIKAALNVGYLIALGAQLQNDSNYQEQTALDAVSLNYELYSQIANIIFNYLKQNSISSEEFRFIDFIFQSNTEIFNIFQNQLNQFFSSRLEYATIQEIQYLMNLGADLNWKDKKRTTPLMKALAFRRPLEIILFLIQSGANWDHENNDGISVTDFAVFNKYQPEQIDLMYATFTKYKSLDWVESLIGPFDPIAEPIITEELSEEEIKAIEEYNRPYED